MRWMKEQRWEIMRASMSSRMRGGICRSSNLGEKLLGKGEQVDHLILAKGEQGDHLILAKGEQDDHLIL
jgi:hypothetical protein